MEWVTLPAGFIDEHGSVDVHLTEAARISEGPEFRTHSADIAPGGRLGRHPARLWQLFFVARGEGWVSIAEHEKFPIVAGEAVLWEPREVHESGSDSGMLVVMVQSTMRPIG